MEPRQPADVISAEPRRVPSRAAWLTAMVVMLAAALAGAIIIAVHYRDQVLVLRRQAHLAQVSPPVGPGRARPAPPTLVSEMSLLPSSGPLTGEVIAFTARSPATLAQVIVTVRISGGRPYSRYELIGGDCAGSAADWAWAAGLADARGSAVLTGQVRTVSLQDEYSLILGGAGLQQNRPGPAVHGYFGIARGLSAVRDSFPPCAS